MSQQRSAGRQRSAGGMVGAMVVLVVLVLGWVGFRALTTDDQTSALPTVDYGHVARSARTAADFDLTAPPRLPEGWRATSVNYVDGARQHWHLGVLTDRDRYVGLEQGDQSVTSMVQAYVDPAATRGRPIRVSGQPWASYTDTGGDLGLVHRQGRTTTLVVGHEVPQATLVSYAESLR